MFISMSGMFNYSLLKHIFKIKILQENEKKI